MDTQLDFSLATEEDYDGVMAISRGIYEGMDPLPVKYHMWLQETNRRTFVAKCKGQVVALESFCIVDDGRTAVGQGLRVAPSEQGKGIAGRIKSFGIDFMKTHFPTVKVLRISKNEKPSVSMLSRYRLIHSKAVLSLLLKAEEAKEMVHVLKSRLEKDGYCFQPPLTLQDEDVRKVCLNETVIDKLLLARMLIQCWLPVRPTSSNLDYLLAKSITFMADNSEEPNFISLLTPPFKVPLEDNCYRLEIDLFGTDPVSAKTHFLAQLLKGLEVINTEVIGCTVCMDKTLFPTLVLFCEGSERNILQYEQFIMEKDI